MSELRDIAEHEIAVGASDLSGEGKPILDRLMDKVTIGDGCWEWQASLDRKGYGRLRYRKRGWQAHRFLYELLVGPIPDGLELDHLCRNPRCVKPAHLEPVTRQVNQLRGFSVSGRNARKTHCPQGHEYAPENIYWTRKGHRLCRTCQRSRSLRDQERRRAA